MSERVNPDKTDNVVGALGAANQRLMRENARLREALREVKKDLRIASHRSLDRAESRIDNALGDTPDE
jgi:hypothetical protein